MFLFFSSRQAFAEMMNAILRINKGFLTFSIEISMFEASRIVLVALESDKRNATGELIFPMLDEGTKAIIRTNDLMIIRSPYVILGIVVIFIFALIALIKIPITNNTDKIHPWQSAKRLFANRNYREGIIAQMFYVAAQIMCWTIIIQYADNLGID